MFKFIKLVFIIVFFVPALGVMFITALGAWSTNSFDYWRELWTWFFSLKP